MEKHSASTEMILYEVTNQIYNNFTTHFKTQLRKLNTCPFKHHLKPNSQPKQSQPQTLISTTHNSANHSKHPNISETHKEMTDPSEIGPPKQIKIRVSISNFTRTSTIQSIRKSFLRLASASRNSFSFRLRFSEEPTNPRERESVWTSKRERERAPFCTLPHDLTTRLEGACFALLWNLRTPFPRYLTLVTH